MLLSLNGRRIAYDLLGAEGAPVVCFTHSLAADGGMWAEQVPPLLEMGWRVLRLDMRGHGGSDPVAGPYTMSALAADVAGALDVLGIAREDGSRAVRLTRPGATALAREFGIRFPSAVAPPPPAP